jgi:superfamily II DNA or RNA helicase
VSLILRPYQLKGIEDIRDAFRRGYSRPLYVAPTGSGKSALFSAIAHGAASKGNRVLILSHRIELVDQISLALTNAGTEHGFIAAGFPSTARSCMIASVPSLLRRLNKAADPQLIILDEAHHARAASWETILARWPDAKVLGVTATPVRTSGEGLAKIFDTLICGPTVAELTPEFLAPAQVWAPPTIDVSGLHMLHGDYVVSESEARANKPSVTGDAISHYRKHADALPALAFCVSVKHATDVAAQFRDAGYSAVMLKGGLDRQVRRAAVNDFRNGKIQLISSCDLLTEGVDFPGAHVGIMLRPTQSLGLWRQMCGRLIRPCEGKSIAVILDHAGNCARFGRPIDEPQWALTYDETKKKRNATLAAKICPKCWSANAARAFVCANCGERFRVAPRSEIEEQDGELVEITAEMLEKRAARREQGLAQSLESLRELARRKGYSLQWADHVFAARQAKRARQ